MRKDKDNIYFAQQPKNLLLYEVWRNNIHTGQYVTRKDIKKMLDADQFNKFLEGDTIFLVPKETKIKEKTQRKLTGRIGQTFKLKK